MASEDEEMTLSAVTTFTGGFDTLLREVLSLSVPLNLRAFSMAQTANAWVFFAASEIALPSLSSLVASCKISESSATKKPRIKIQANIVPSLRRLPLRRQIFPRPLVVRKQIVKDRSLSRTDGAVPLFGFSRVDNVARLLPRFIADGAFCYSDRCLTARYGSLRPDRTKERSRRGVKGTRPCARLRFLTYLSVCSVTGDYLDVLRVIAQRYPYPYFI
jgi:hypothetical protein